MPYALPPTSRAALYVLCISRAGYVQGARLIEFIEEWRRCVEHYGGPVTITCFVAWTRLYGNRRTVELRLKLFRKTFPQLPPPVTPDQLMQPLLERLAAKEAERTTE